MSQCDDAFVSVARIQKVWNEGEDFARDLVNRCERVFPKANQAEDFRSASLESVDLEYIKYQLRSTHPFRWFA